MAPEPRRLLPRGGTRAWAWAVALAAPVVAVVALLTVASRPGLMGDASVQAARMAERDPAVVLVGSSVARQALDAEVFAAAWGVAPLRVQHVTVNDSSTPHWEVALRNRVFGAGAEPALVVIASSAGQFLQANLDDPVDRRRFAAELAGDEPVAMLSALGARSTLAVRGLRLAVRGEAVMAQVVHHLRRAGVGVWLGIAPARAEEALRRSSGAFTPPPLDELLASDPALARRYVDQLARFEAPDPVEATRVGPMVRAARAQGAGVVVVRLPVPPDNPHTDRLPTRTVAELAAAVVNAGGVFVDARDWTLPDGGWEDLLHMTPAGRRAFTTRLLDHLATLGVAAEAP